MYLYIFAVYFCVDMRSELYKKAEKKNRQQILNFLYKL
jgi:hypothetical protein